MSILKITVYFLATKAQQPGQEPTYEVHSGPDVNVASMAAAVRLDRYDREQGRPTIESLVVLSAQWGSPYLIEVDIV